MSLFSFRELPHVVFLAEVIPASQSILEEECPAYCIIPGSEEHYFTAVMLHNTSVQLEDSTILPFDSSSMYRNLLTVKVRA